MESRKKIDGVTLDAAGVAALVSLIFRARSGETVDARLRVNAAISVSLRRPLCSGLERVLLGLGLGRLWGRRHAKCTDRGQ